MSSSVFTARVSWLLGLVLLAAGFVAVAAAPSDASPSMSVQASSSKKGNGAVGARSRKGPALTVPRAKLSRALKCRGRLRKSPQQPVLFIHGTTTDAATDFGWNWNRFYRQRKWGYCNIELPDYANGDIQVSAQYVTHAIRTMHRRAQRQISMVGHSQGGTVGRWSLKFWPDTRRMVDDYIGLAASSHGTALFDAQCAAAGECLPAQWQQRASARFIRILNRGRETYPGISYTEITTVADEVILPYTSSYLTPGRNVTNTTVQDLCPGQVADHFSMSIDNAAWLIARDALTHRGPARLKRISTATCGRPFMPAVDPTEIPGKVAQVADLIVRSNLTSPRSKREPESACYAKKRNCGRR